MYNNIHRKDLDSRYPQKGFGLEGFSPATTRQHLFSPSQRDNIASKIAVKVC
jgi:hypothetical protein